MKKILFSLLSVLFMAAVICCGDSDDPVQNVELKNFANTGCKGNNTRAGEEGGREEFIEYSVIHDGFLYLNHQNVLFNCCPGELGADISVDGTTITVHEYETEQGCKCICTYDLSYEIGPLTEGTVYTICITRRDADTIEEKFVFKNAISGIWKTLPLTIK